MDKQTQQRMDEIYSNTPADQIPWNNDQPPELLVELVESGKVKPGRALDLGCGLGNYAIWLAGKGFEVVGIDAAPTAIEKANQNARLRLRFAGQAGRKTGKCEFVVADVTGKWPEFERPFDFVYDWGLLHHILPENRNQYVENVHKALKPKGKYVSLCFNEKDAAHEGTGKYRSTRIGTTVYLSSEQELRELFGRYFEIIDFRVLEAAGKSMAHVLNYCFMERK